MRMINITLEDNPNYPLWGVGCYVLSVDDPKGNFSTSLQFTFDEEDFEAQIGAYSSANNSIDEIIDSIKNSISTAESVSFAYDLCDKPFKG